MQWPALQTSTREKDHMNPQQFDQFSPSYLEPGTQLTWPDWSTRNKDQYKPGTHDNLYDDPDYAKALDSTKIVNAATIMLGGKL